MVGLCNIPLSHSSTLRADIFTLLHYCNRQAHVLSVCVCVQSRYTHPAVFSNMQLHALPSTAGTCVKDRKTRERKEGIYCLAVREKKGQLTNVTKRKIVCMHMCVCDREPPSLGVVYGLVTATFLHSAASEHSRKRWIEKRG